jgi:hypothetical protein
LRLGGAEDVEVQRIVVDVGELQAPLQCGLGLRHPFEFGLMMGDLEAEVRQMMLKLSESENFSDHSPVIGDFDVFEQRAIVSGGSCE